MSGAGAAARSGIVVHAPPSATRDALDLKLAHQAGDAFAPDADPVLLAQLGMHRGAPYVSSESMMTRPISSESSASLSARFEGPRRRQA